MSVLDEVIDLKGRGATDREVISSLREKGFSPKEINDGLSQARIKEAVTSDRTSEDMEASMLVPERAEELPTEGELTDEDLTPPTPYPQRTFMPQGPMHQETDSEEEEYVPQPLPEYTPPTYASPEQAPYQDYQQEYQQSESPQQGYAQEGYEYQPQTGGSLADTDTVIEISEQVFSDKTRNMAKQLEALNEFKTLAEAKIENMSERLKRLEASIDKLQMAILDKVGSYGRGLDTVKKEMDMMQDSFGKVLGSAHKSERKHHSHESHAHHAHSAEHHSTHHKASHTKHHKRK